MLAKNDPVVALEAARTGKLLSANLGTAQLALAPRPANGCAAVQPWCALFGNRPSYFLGNYIMQYSIDAALIGEFVGTMVLIRLGNGVVGNVL
jgi:hypothetical protein